MISDKMQNTLSEDPENVREIESLRSRLKNVENTNIILQQNYEEVTNDCEESYKMIKILETQIEGYKNESDVKKPDKQKAVAAEIQKKDKMIEELKRENKKLESEVEAAEKNWKILNKTVKAKDKEVHDLKKENAVVTENLLKVKIELTNFTAKVSREKKTEEKKTKKKEKKEFIENLKSTSHSVNFECEKCDFKTESSNVLKNHVITFHIDSKSTQTEEKLQDDKAVQSFQSEFSSDKKVQTIEETKLEIKMTERRV